MHICPQCQFKNSDADHFCRSCGASLTHKPCPNCNTSVELNISHCPNCHTLTATTWWTILDSQDTEINPRQILQSSSHPPEDLYLDPEHRYRLWLETEAVPEDSSKVTRKFRVFDLNPLQQSKLDGWLDNLSSEESRNQEEILSYLQPYVELRETFSTVIPHLHDAWFYKDHSIILLEDRSQWPLFVDLWESDDLPTLQILCWLDQMAKLWQKFDAFGCCQSLLTKDNLRLDEDQSLCIQQLYFNSSDVSSNLQNLGGMWQLLFSKSERTYYGPLAKLLDDTVRGKVDNVEALREQLQALAAHEQETSYVSPGNQQSKGQPIQSPEDAMTSSYSSDSPNYPDSNREELPAGDMPTLVLPMQIRSLDDAGCTDIGGRPHNEDNFGIASQIKKRESPFGQSVTAQGLYIVCDGMGGHEAGEVASKMAVESLYTSFKDHWQSSELPDEEIIRQGILAANQAIYADNASKGNTGTEMMGTTLVMALVQDTKIAIAHVGDSRIYRITRRGIEQLTTDHEVGQRDIKNGVDPKDAYARKDAYQLTQALGPRNNKYVNPDIQFRELNEDTLLLLCSDGLSDHNLLEENFQTHLTPLLSSRTNLEQGLIELIRFANQENGHDNITGVLIRIKVRPNMEHHKV